MATDSAGPLTRREVIILIAILALAAITRLGWPGLTEFKADEARLLSLALTMSDGQLAVRGISSSVGFPNAPMSVWLYSLPLWLWSHPYAATLFTGVLGVLAVAGVYWLGRRHGGITTAAVAALMLAASPWAIVFSRKIWAQNLLPAFAVGWAIGAVLTYAEGRRPFIALHLVCLAVVVQIHPAAIGLVPATLLLMLLYRREVDWRYVVVGVGVGLLTAAPFLIYLWQRWQAAGALPLAGSQSASRLSFDSLWLTLEISRGGGMRPLAGPAYGGLPGEAIARWMWLALILAATAWSIRQVIRRPSDPTSRTLLVYLAWFLGPALLFAWQWTPIYIHYFIVALPAPFLLSGHFVQRIMGRVDRTLRPFITAALLILAAWQLASWANVMVAVARDPAAGGFGIPLGAKLPAADAARQLMAESGAAEVLLVGEGSNPAQDDFPAEFGALLHSTPQRFVDINKEALFPSGAAVVLLDEPAGDDLTSTRSLYEVALSPAPANLAVPPYTVGLLPAAAAPPAAVALPESALLANFVRLTGHNAPRILPTGMIWDVYWRPADNPDPADYHIFNHLLDGSKERVAQADGAAFAAAQWRPGDVVISRFHLPFSNEPQPPLTMRVGMYHFPSLEFVPVLDAAANPAADAVEFPLER